MDRHAPVRWFKSQRVDFTSSTNIDADKGIISDVIMCQVGEAKGHGVHLEQSFIEAGIAYAQQHHAERGMKARFGHPSMSSETLGSEMGVFKNFRVQDDKMIADLHLYESANLSPTNPGMKDWMLSMAEEDPNAIMCSIVFKPEYEYQYNELNERVNIWFCNQKGRWERVKGENGEPTLFDRNKKLYTSLDKMMFCDIVDQGAATDKLFSEQFNSDKFGVIATQFLNEHPELDAFLNENPEKILQFLSDRHDQTEEQPSESKGVFEAFKSFFSKPDSYYMSKIQLTALSKLQEAVKKGETPTPEMYQAVQEEFASHGIEVQLAGAPADTPEETSEETLSENAPEVVQSLTDQLTQANTELGQANTKISDLEQQLADAGKPALTPKPDQQFDEQDDIQLSADEQELADIVQGANELMFS